MNKFPTLEPLGGAQPDEGYNESDFKSARQYTKPADPRKTANEPISGKPKPTVQLKYLVTPEMTLRAVKHYQKSMKHRFMTVFFIIFGIGLLNLLAFLSVSLSNTANIILSFIAPRGGFSPESGVFTLVNAVLILLFAVEARTYFRTKRFNNLFREKQNTERTAACFFMQELFLVFLDRDAAPRYIEDYTDNIMNARGFRAVPQELPPHLAHSFVNSTEFTEDFQYANFSEGDHNVRVLVYDSVMCYEYNDMFMFLNKFLKYEGGFYFVPKFGLSEKDLNFIRTVLKPKNVRSIKSGR